MRKKSYLKKKQYLDIYLCLMALVFLSPFFLALMIAIKLDSPGPVFFKQKRIGIHKKHFFIIKVPNYAYRYAKRYADPSFKRTGSVYYKSWEVSEKNIPG